MTMPDINYRSREKILTSEERRKEKERQWQRQRERDIEDGMRRGISLEKLKIESVTHITGGTAEKAKLKKIQESQRAYDLYQGSRFNPRRAGWL